MTVTVSQDKPREAHIYEFLTRDQRDAICAALVYLAVLQDRVDDLLSQRIQKTVNILSDMIYPKDGTQ